MNLLKDGGRKGGGTEGGREALASTAQHKPQTLNTGLGFSPLGCAAESAGVRATVLHSKRIGWEGLEAGDGADALPGRPPPCASLLAPCYGADLPRALL